MRSFASLDSAYVASSLLAAGLFLGRPALADDAVAAPPHSYALLVGDNQGGPGQEPLRFAEADAASLAAVLHEVGHYDASDIRVLLHPDAAQVLGALDEVVAKVRADA